MNLKYLYEHLRFKGMLNYMVKYFIIMYVIWLPTLVCINILNSIWFKEYVVSYWYLPVHSFFAAFGFTFMFSIYHRS